jgi:hypothetical protein
MGRSFRSTLAASAALGAAIAGVVCVTLTGLSVASLYDVLAIAAFLALGAVTGACVASVVWCIRPRQPCSRQRLLLLSSAQGAAAALALLAVAMSVWGAIDGGGISHAAPGPGIRGAVFMAFFSIAVFGLPAVALGALLGPFAGCLAGARRPLERRNTT